MTLKQRLEGLPELGPSWARRLSDQAKYSMIYRHELTLETMHTMKPFSSILYDSTVF